MKEKLVQLHNTLGMIQTKGESTLLMSECILCVRQMINELKQGEVKGEGHDVKHSSEAS